MREPSAFPLVIAGVAGSGKSTIAGAWSGEYRSRLIEGDLFHSDASIAKMRAGVALEDADRMDWLERLAIEVRVTHAPPFPVLACSALKRRYRDYLRGAVPGLHLVLLEVPIAIACERVAARSGHFMPPTLVNSQFVTLEVPVEEPCTLLLDGRRPVADLLSNIGTWLRHA